MRILLVPLGVLFFTGCAPAYLKAASAFAVDGQAQLKQLAPAEPLSSQLCFTRARLDLLHRRLDGKDERWGSQPGWSTWMEAHRDEAGKTWRQRCTEQRAGDAVLHQAVNLMRAYLAQVHGVAEGQLPLGASPSLVAKGITSAINQLHLGMVSETAKALEGPLTDVVDLMLKQYDAHELRPLLVEGDPAFQKLVAALNQYVDEVDRQRVEVERMQGQVLDQLEASLAAPSTDEPARTITFVQFSQQVDAQVRSTSEAIQTYREVLAALASTHAALAREAQGLPQLPQSAR